MTMNNPSRWRPLISRLLAPRSIRTVLLIVLVPFIVVPLLVGYARFMAYRQDLLQQANITLATDSATISNAIARWQKKGADKISLLGQDPDIVNAAITYRQDKTEANGNYLLAIVYEKQFSDLIFFDMAVVDTTTNKIAVATKTTWEGQPFPANEWTFPYSQSIFNIAPFGDGQLRFAVAAPIHSTTAESGMALVGFLRFTDLATILASTNATAPERYLYLANPAQGWKAFLDSVGTFQAQQFTGANSLPSAQTASYTNSFGTVVVGQMHPVFDASTQLVTEQNEQSVFGSSSILTSFSLFIGLGILVSIVLAAVSIWFFVAQPLAHLTAAANRILAGHMEEPPAVIGTSESVAMGNALAKITRELRSVSQFMGADGQITTRKVVTSTELTQTLANVSTVDEVLKTVVTITQEHLGVAFAAIYLLDEAGQFAIIREATGDAGERLKAQGQRFPLGSYTIIGSVAQTARAHNSAITAEDPMFVRNDLLSDTRAEAAVPIRARRRTIGVLDVHSVTANAFTPDDIDLLQSIADQTGTTIDTVQIIEAANISTDVSQQLFRTSRLISLAARPEEIYKAALEGLKSTTYNVALLMAEGDRLNIIGYFDPANPEAETPPVPFIADPSESLTRLLPSSQPIVLKVLSELSRLPQNMRTFLESLGCRVAGFLPLRQGERLIGAILLASPNETALTLNRVRSYMPLAEQILIAIERLELIQSTQGRLTELVTLNRISQLISSAPDLEALCETVHEQIHSAMGDCDVIFALFEQNRDILNFPYAFLNGQSAQLDSTPVGDSLYATVIQTGQPLMLVQNLEERAATLGARVPQESLKSWLGVPLVSASQVIGVLVVQDTEKEKRFDENDLRLLATIGAQVASTIRTSLLLLESERKALQLQTAAEITRETISLLDLDRLLSISVNLIRDRFGFYHASVFLLDEERKFAILHESTGEAGRQMKARGHKLGIGSQSIIGWVTQNARPRVADDVTADPMHRANPLLPATRSELGIPMKIGETVVGALDIQSTLPYAFTPDDIAILQVIADQITVAVENARLFRQTREYLTRHQSLYQVTASAAASTTVDNALFSVAQGLRSTMPGARVAIFLLNPEKDALVVRAQVGFVSSEMDKLRIPMGQGIPGWVAVNRQNSLVPNTATDSRYLMIDSDVQSELCIPLIHHDELLGVLDTQSARPEAFIEDDVQLLGTVASSLSAILSSTILFEQVTQERERLRHLYEEAIGMAGPPGGNMETLVRNAIERIRTVVGSDCVAIAFPSNPGEARVEMCTCEPQYHHLTGSIAKYGQDVIGQAISTNQVVAYAPATGTGDLSKTLAQSGIKSALALPLQWAGRSLGALLISRMTTDRPFSNEDTQLVSLLALQLAASIESARLFDQTRRQAEREHMLFEITSRIRRSVDMQGILSTTASELSKALGAKRATIKIGGAEDANPTVPTP
jgi:GAF domain-containing protein